MREFIATLEKRVLAGGQVTLEEGVRLMEQTGRDELMDLMAAADRIRRKFMGDEVHLCSIVNAKSGRCSEDCGFCSQSVRFETGVDEYELIDAETAKKAGREAADNGAEALGLVAAWRGLKPGPELEAVLQLVRDVSQDGSVRVDASFGLIDDPEVARALKAAGLHTYNHNLETAKSHFGTVCETHAWEDRVTTIRHLREAGVHICSGGILGMGETPAQRVELALELREIDPDIVPLNFLNPIEGTPQQVHEPLEPLEALKCIAVFRFMLPTHHIMVAGGREVALRSLQPMMYMAGASATMVGNYLTTDGQPASADLAVISDQDMTPEVAPAAVEPEVAAAIASTDEAPTPSETTVTSEG
jgi:biotin synthase